VLTEEEYRTCTHYILSSEARWDPGNALAGTHSDPGLQRLIEGVRINEETINANPRERQVPVSDSEIDVVMTSVSSAYSDGALLNCLVLAVKIVSYFEQDKNKVKEEEDGKPYSIKAANTKSRHYKVTPDILAQGFGCGIETARKTLQATSQYGVRQATHPLTRRY
jgi:hypothetical protein